MLLNIHLRRVFQRFADEVSDERRAGDLYMAYKLIAESMKSFGNSAYGKPSQIEKKILY